MSVKDNIEYIKEELSNEEKMLEQIVKAERFYKKYRIPIISAVAAAVLFAVGYFAMEYKKSVDLKESNAAYLKLLKNPSDSEALEVLKSKNEPLYRAYLFKKAVREGDVTELERIAAMKVAAISDLALYQGAALKESADSLDSYRLRQEALLKEMAQIDEAFLLFSKGEIAKGSEILKAVPSDSVAYPYARFLLHYGIAEGAR